MPQTEHQWDAGLMGADTHTVGQGGGVSVCERLTKSKPDGAHGGHLKGLVSDNNLQNSSLAFYLMKPLTHLETM